jgi:L-alanine-DL-glutamate epimerase-like enolase superfamily enzyme
MTDKATDLRVVDTQLYFLPVETRVPLKFGPETVTYVTCARAAVICENGVGRRVTGWGETPLSVTWVWPSHLPYEERHDQLRQFCLQLADDWAGYPQQGDALEVGHSFLADVLRSRLDETNRQRITAGREPMPFLAALVCASLFDIAIHDAFGKLCDRPIYECYTSEYLNRDLSAYLTTESGEPDPTFSGKYPADFFAEPPRRLPAWHLVGGLDALQDSDLSGSEPSDGYPVTLTEWIERDGLVCLKIKLRGNDAAWDYQRVVSVGQIALATNVLWLTTDFNCTVQDPAYVNDILDRLLHEEPRIYAMILYVEQPFPYDLRAYQIDVRSTSARKPLFMDESAHDWQLVRLGRQLGWTGVALKTCKTQTGALLSLCWAAANGMTLMVQDLTNPMLAQIPHLQLAAHAGTIQGVETNAMQFYPEASAPEAVVHPDLYRRRLGMVDLSSLRGPGFGYRLVEIQRTLPAPTRSFDQQ